MGPTMFSYADNILHLHRYQRDLLAWMRTDYVHEQQKRYRTQRSHPADQNIEFYLNDGEKVNCAKFGDALAKIK